MFLVVLLCVSCFLTGLAMAEDAQASAEGESSGDSMGAIMNMFSSGESAESASVEAEGESTESAAGESAGESAENASGESAGESSEEAMAEYEAMMEELGLKEIVEFDWGGFYEEIDKRVENGEELTMEEAFPDFLWTWTASMMTQSLEDDEESGYTVEMEVSENRMINTWKFNAVLDEEDAQEVAESVEASFNKESLSNMKRSMEQMCEPFNIDINKLEWGLVMLNGDDSVIYERVFTYADLTGLLDEAQETE